MTHNLQRIPINATDLHALVVAREVLSRLALTPEAGGLADVVGGSLATVLKLCYLDDSPENQAPQGDSLESPGHPAPVWGAGGVGNAGAPGTPFMPSKPTLHQPKAKEVVEEQDSDGADWEL